MTERRRALLRAAGAALAVARGAASARGVLALVALVALGTLAATTAMAGGAAAAASVTATPQPAPARPAATLQVAVAANFLGTLQKLAPLFERTSADTLRLSAGSTGALYAQIQQGAPFDVFLSADALRPQRLESQGLAVAGSRFTYAIGTLVLWSPSPGELGASGEAPRVLRAAHYRFLAIADPGNAPYGAAARQVLTALGLWAPLQQHGQLVIGTNITQAWQFVASGNAQLGFVALSQVIGPQGRPSGSYWLPPPSLYRPIDQDAVLIARSAHREAAAAFMRWLRTAPAAQAAIRAAGYRTGGD